MRPLSKDRIESVPALFFIFIFMLPIFFLLLNGRKLSFQFDPYFYVILKGAVVQSLFSGFFVTLVGYFGGMQLAQVSLVRKRDYFFRFLLVLPALLPSLLVLSSAVGAVNVMPRGLFGVVTLHLIINIGLSSLIWEIWIRQKLMNSLVLASSYQISFLKLHTKILVPLLKKDFLKSFVLWFFVFFASFDIPYFVGGLRYGGIEVFLYEQIYWLGDWSRALGFSILLFIFWTLAAILSPQKISTEPLKMKRWGWRGFNHHTFLICIPSIFVFVALLKGGFHSFGDFYFLAFKNSLGLGLSVGLSLFLSFSLLLFWNPSLRFLNLLFYCAPPSSLLIVFGIYLIPDHSFLGPFLKAMLCFVLILFPFLYRLGFLQKRTLLQANVDKAIAMGLSKTQRFHWIIFPQMLPVLALLSGLGALWAVGDFVIPSFFFPEMPLLSRKIQFYMSGYQLSKAQAMVGSMSFVCLLLSLIFSGVYFVTYRKSL